MHEAAVSGGFMHSSTGKIYFSESEMNWNVVLSFEPMALTLAMITTEMPAAMRPYSIAVAPVSSFRNATSFDMWSPPGAPTHREASVTPLNGTFLGRSNGPESGYRALGKRAWPIPYLALRYGDDAKKKPP
jgi:hypothetical protein